jgi:hypothetical protein
MSAFKSLVLFTFLIVISRQGLAFPEMIRHGYVNCTACHLSPSGGGLLTNYGRILSAELLSRWSTKGEENLGHGLIDQTKINESLLIGGDIRKVQAHSEDVTQRTDRFIDMQATVETAYNTESFAFDLAVGSYDMYGKNWRPAGPSYYAMWRFQETWSLRAGRFDPAYGLRLAEHIGTTRDPLGFGIQSQREALELQNSGETWNFNITASQGKNIGQNPISDTERAVSVQIQRSFDDKFKVGANVWSGSNSASDSRLVNGIFAILGFTKELYLLTDYEYQTLKANSVETRSTYIWHKFGMEVSPGAHVYAVLDRRQDDLSNSDKYILRYGPGVSFYPRPHFEISGTWMRTKNSENPNLTGSEGDYAWLLLHYYL